MEASELKVSRREVLGKKVRRLRRQGIIPANLYGHNVPSQPLQVSAKEFTEFIKRAGSQRLVNLAIADDGAPRPVLIRRIERMPGIGEIAHIDFYQVKMGEKVRVRVPVVATGEAPALKTTDGILVHNLDTVEIEALPQDLPSAIEVDVAGLETVGDSILVRDLAAPKGVSILSPEEEPVIGIEAPTIEEAPQPPEEEETQAESVPEVGEEETAE